MIGPKIQGMRERILVYGVHGAGKTYAFLSIARLLQEKGSPARMYIVDCDDGVPRMLAEEFPDLENIEIRPAYDWQTATAAMDEFTDKAKLDDWIVVDMIDKPWSSVQSYFTEEVYGKTMGDFLLEIRKEAKTPKEAATAIAREQMWQIIGNLYKDWQKKFIYQNPAHIFATSGLSIVSRDEDAEVRRLYPGGTMPAGHKRLGHEFHTVIQMRKEQSGGKDTYYAQTIKDRGRRPFQEEQVTNFALQYLIGRAGWRLSR